MILRSVELEAFGRFVRRNFEFRRGLNLVVGPNEAGKSTLMEAIPAILFGVRDKKRYIPWGKGSLCKGGLQFETAAGSVRVQRDLVSDKVELVWADRLYQAQRQVSGKVSLRGRSGEKKVYLKELRELLGFGDPDLFRATLFFGQGDLGLDFGKGLAARLKKLLSGSAEVDYDQVLDDLRETLFEVTRENPWGKDKTRDRKLELAERELEQLDLQLRRSEEASRELTALEEQLAALEEQLAGDRRELVRGEKYLLWVKTYWQLEERRSSLGEQLAGLHRQLDKVKEFEARRDSLVDQLSKAGLPENFRNASNLLGALRDARRLLLQLHQLEREQQQLRGLQVRPATGRRMLVWGWLLAASAGCLLGWVRLPGYPLHFALGWLLTVVPVLLLAVWCRGRSAARRSEISGRAQLVQQQLADTERQLDEVDEHLAGAGISVRLEEIEDRIETWEGQRQVLQELGEVSRALEVLPPVAELEGDAARLQEELNGIEQRMQQGRSLRAGVDLEAGDIDEAERKLAELRSRCEQAERERERLWQRRAEWRAALGGRVQIEEERAEVLEEVIRLQSRKRVLTLACQVLQESVALFRSGYLERFAGRIGPYLEEATDGCYRELRLHEDLSISLRTRSGHWRPLHNFSQGTRDAVAVAVRMAFVSYFSQGRKLPLLLDDAMVNLDSERQERMLRLLKKTSSGHQVILFSHDRRLAKRAARERWHVLTLDDRVTNFAQDNEEETDAGQLHLL